MQTVLNILQIGSLSGLLAFSLINAAYPTPVSQMLMSLFFLGFLCAVILSLSRKEAVYIALLLLVFAAIVVSEGDSFAAVIHSLDRGATFVGLLLSLSLLRPPAEAARSAGKLWKQLSTQGGAGQYLRLACGVHVLGAFLNLGALAVVAALSAKGGCARVEAGRLNSHSHRSLATAVSQGFSTVTLWSPATIVIPVVLSIVPGLVWSHLFGIGLVLALVLMVIGSLIHSAGGRAIQSGLDCAEEHSLRAHDALLLAVVPIASTGMIAVLHVLGGLSLVASVVLAVPAVALSWLVAQRIDRSARMPNPAMTEVLGHHLAVRLPSMRLELLAIGLVGVVGGAAATIVPTELLAKLFCILGLTSTLMLTLIVLAVALSGLLGLNPLIAITAIGSALATVDPFPLPALSFALAMIWCMSFFMTASPFSITNLLIGQTFGASPVVVGLKWNAVYNVTSVLLVLTLVWLLLHLGL